MYKRSVTVLNTVGTPRVLAFVVIMLLINSGVRLETSSSSLPLRSRSQM